MFLNIEIDLIVINTDDRQQAIYFSNQKTHCVSPLKRTLEIIGRDFLQTFSVAKPSVSKQWREHKALIPTRKNYAVHLLHYFHADAEMPRWF